MPASIQHQQKQRMKQKQRRKLARARAAGTAHISNGNNTNDASVIGESLRNTFDMLMPWRKKNKE